MATFTPVTITELKEVLKAEKGWKEIDIPHVKERVFDFPLTVRYPGGVIRVYTGIAKGEEVCRPCGADAFRVCAVDARFNRGLRKAKRVHRVVNWRSNLRARILSVLESFPPRPYRVQTPKPVVVNADIPPNLNLFVRDSADDKSNFGTY